MTTSGRFAVPLDALDSVRVDVTEQLREQAAPATDDGCWGRSFVPAFGDGGGSCCDGD